METGNSVTSIESHSDAILEVRFQPASPIFATASADRTVRLSDTERIESLSFYIPFYTTPSFVT
jgi:WD40 repeat protein